MLRENNQRPLVLPATCFITIYSELNDRNNNCSQNKLCMINKRKASELINDKIGIYRNIFIRERKTSKA